MDEAKTISPDMLLSPTFVNSPDGFFPQRSTTRMASSLPVWLWRLLSYCLGTSRCNRLAKAPKLVSTILKVMTFATASCFGISGLVLNVHEAVSDYTKITELVCVFKSAVGLFWIMLGTYSYSLAVRSFSSEYMLNFIRFHSKTFLKVSVSIWMCLLCVGMLCANIYSNVYLVDDGRSDEGNVTHEGELYYYTCPNVNLQVAICQIYFYSKVAFCSLNLVWILIMVSVCLSVCRTHAIYIRRFAKELSYDMKIFEEFNTLKRRQMNKMLLCSDPTSDFTATSDSVSLRDVATSPEDDLEAAFNGKKVWTSLRKINDDMSQQTKSVQSEFDTSGDPGLIQSRETHPSDRAKAKLRIEDEGKEENGDAGKGEGLFGCKTKGDDPYLLHDLSNMKAPIMNTDDLLFTYFKTVKYLSATSLMLQRWISLSVSFVIVWCTLLVTYWTAHKMDLLGVVQFMVPLIVLGFLISAYAEVNFEGTRLSKYVLPTEDRRLVLYYVRNWEPQLKVYGYPLTFTVLATVVTGAALTFATKIVLSSMK